VAVVMEKWPFEICERLLQERDSPNLYSCCATACRAFPVTSCLLLMFFESRPPPRSRRHRACGGLQRFVRAIAERRSAGAFAGAHVGGAGLGGSVGQRAEFRSGVAAIAVRRIGALAARAPVDGLVGLELDRDGALPRYFRFHGPVFRLMANCAMQIRDRAKAGSARFRLSPIPLGNNEARCYRHGRITGETPFVDESASIGWPAWAVGEGIIFIPTRNVGETPDFRQAASTQAAKSPLRDGRKWPSLEPQVETRNEPAWSPAHSCRASRWIA